MPRSHAYLLWSLLALPAIFMLWQALNASVSEIFGELAHPAAEFAARLMIVAMMITPLMLFFKGSEALRWLRKSRRALGVAAFAYAALHVMFYLIDRGTTAKVLADLSELYIWAGWLGLLHTFYLAGPAGCGCFILFLWLGRPAGAASYLLFRRTNKKYEMKQLK